MMQTCTTLSDLGSPLDPVLSGMDKNAAEWASSVMIGSSLTGGNQVNLCASSPSNWRRLKCMILSQDCSLSLSSAAMRSASAKKLSARTNRSINEM